MEIEMNPASFVEAAISAAYTKRIRLSRQSSNRASQAGLACRRRLLWSRTRTLEQKPPEEWLQRIFERGNILEDSTVKAIEEGGVKILQRQRDVEWKDLQLTGHIDGLVTFCFDDKDPDETTAKGPLEVKSITRYLFESVKKNPTLAGILAREDHVARYPVQTGLYAWLGGWPFAVLVFVCADTLRTLAIWIDPLDDVLLPKVQEHLHRLDEVNAAMKNGKDLDGEPGKHCDRCPFLGPCAPNRTWALTTSVIDDGEIIEKVKRRLELHPLHLEFTHLDEDLKKDLPPIAGDYIAGDIVVKTTCSTTTKYPLTPELKKQLAVKETIVRRAYEKIGTRED